VSTSVSDECVHRSIDPSLINIAVLVGANDLASSCKKGFVHMMRLGVCALVLKRYGEGNFSFIYAYGIHSDMYVCVCVLARLGNLLRGCVKNKPTEEKQERQN